MAVKSFIKMKDTFYFPHDYDTLQDEKIKRMIRKHGMIGYGVFWAIVEMLYMNANALRTDYQGIAFDLRTDCNIVTSIICDFDLFVVHENKFRSLSVERRLVERAEKSRKARRSAIYRWENANALRTECEGNAIKEKKEKKINKYNGESEDSPTEFSFENVWEQYGRKGNRKSSMSKWSKLSESNKKLALNHIPGYVNATPDKQYRKNFETYLNQEVWNDSMLPTKSKQIRSETNSKMPDLDVLYLDSLTVNK